MAAGSTLSVQLAALGLQTPCWPGESQGTEAVGGWIQLGLDYAEGIRLWRAQLRNASESARSVLDQLMRHLHEQGKAGVWNELVYAAIKPELQGSPEYERWQACTKLIRSSALTPAQLLGCALEMGREQRLTAATYCLRRLLKEQADLTAAECLQLFVALVTTADTSNIGKEAFLGSDHWRRAVAWHEQWAGLLAEAASLRQNELSSDDQKTGYREGLIARLDRISHDLGRVGSHGHSEFLMCCRERLPGLLRNWRGELPWIVEVGCSREIIEGQNSTAQLIQLAQELGVPFAGIDLDQDNIAALQRDHGGPACHWITGKGEEILASWDQPILACYLDAYDFMHLMHSELRQATYIKAYGKSINDQQCHLMHLKATECAARRIVDGGIIGIDDTWTKDDSWTGKGTLALPWLLERGWELLSQADQGTILRKSVGQQD